LAQSKWAEMEKKPTQIPWAWLKDLELQIRQDILTWPAFWALQSTFSQKKGSPQPTAKPTAAWTKCRSNAISASFLIAVIDKIVSINSGNGDSRVLHPSVAYAPRLFDLLSDFASVVPSGEFGLGTEVVEALYQLTFNDCYLLKSGSSIAPGIYNRWLESQIPSLIRDIRNRHEQQLKEQPEREEEDRRKREEEEQRKREEEKERIREAEEQRKREEEEKKKHILKSKRECLEGITTALAIVSGRGKTPLLTLQPLPLLVNHCHRTYRNCLIGNV
jgi:hypothetical protein